MTTMTGPPPLPGDVHPAWVDRADAIRDSVGDQVQVPYDPADFAVSKHTLTRQRAYHPGLLPGYGAWTWDIWTDEVGRHVADRPERTRWKPHPDAWLLGEWNPGPTFLVGPDGRWWHVNTLSRLPEDLPR